MTPARSGLRPRRGRDPWTARRTPRDPSSTPESQPCADHARRATPRGHAARYAARESSGHAADARHSERLRVQCGGRNVTGAKALAPLDPLRGLPALTTTSVERTEGSYVMAGVSSVSVRISACADERRRPAAGSWTFTPQRRILAAATGRCATSCSAATFPPSHSEPSRARWACNATDLDRLARSRSSHRTLEGGRQLRSQSHVTTFKTRKETGEWA